MAYQNNQNSRTRKSLRKYPISRIPDRGDRRSFTLLEVLVAIAIFGLVVAAAARTFASIQTAWRKQRNTIDLVQNARWALERIANELRNGANISTPGGDRVRFELSPGGPANRVWYWRGNTASDTTVRGNRNFLYRGPGISITVAYSNRQQLADFIVDNPPPGSDPIFANAGGLITITLTVRPNPALPPTAPGNRDYTLRTRVRVRN